MAFSDVTGRIQAGLVGHYKTATGEETTSPTTAYEINFRQLLKELIFLLLP